MPMAGLRGETPTTSWTSCPRRWEERALSSAPAVGQRKLAVLFARRMQAQLWHLAPLAHAGTSITHPAARKASLRAASASHFATVGIGRHSTVASSVLRVASTLWPSRSPRSTGTAQDWRCFGTAHSAGYSDMIDSPLQRPIGMWQRSSAGRLLTSCHVLNAGLALALLASGSTFFCSNAEAGQEYRLPAVTWRLWGGDAADFNSPEEAFGAFNAAAAAVFDACVANQNCGSCNKIAYTGVSKLGPYPVIVNGQQTSVATDTSTSTNYIPACAIDYGGGNIVTHPPSGPTTSTTSGAGIAAVAIQRCPPGWAITRSRSLGTQTIDGQTVPVSEEHCGKEIPQPCRSCTRFGNPIDAVAASKLASETDYQSADESLRVRRTYSSAEARWSWEHDDSVASQRMV